MITRRAATGIVLAGGRSSRFGSDKLAVQLDGRPLLHHAIEAVGLVCAEVLVVVGPDGAPDLPHIPGTDLRLVRDPEPLGGPLVGLGAGLAAASYSVALAVGGDMPRLEAAVLVLMLDAVGSAEAAILDVAGGRLQTLPMALRVEPARTAHERIREAGGRSLRQLLDELDLSRIPVATWRALDAPGSTIIDIDRPSDLPS
ncbi:MAG: molybdenum cofactor guanylyltransferase [Candidatus Limnocylindrales bacterium]